MPRDPHLCLLDFCKIPIFNKCSEPPGKKTGSTEEGLWALGDLVEEFVLSKILGITTVPKNDGNPYEPVKMDDKRF